MTELDLLKLPWELQIAFASGYAAYAVSYTGLRDRQRPIDIAFISLVFSVPATMLFGLLSSFKWGMMISIPLAFAIAISAGIVWRRFKPCIFTILKKWNVTWSNDDPSALATIIGNSKFPVSQVAVLLDDGMWLRCDDVLKFEHAPFWPYVLGPNGDIALYLTHEEPAGAEAKVPTTVRDEYYGDRITYVPAVRIKQIAIRHKANHFSKEAASGAVLAEPLAD
jgi:hypothetical protein